MTTSPTRLRQLAVVVPTFRRPDLLVEALDSIAAQTGAPPFRLFVVENDSEGQAGTRAATDWIARTGWADRATVVVAKERGFSQSRNAGLAAAFARPEIDAVAMMDDDTVADPTWVAAIVEALEAHDPDLLGGPTIYSFATDVPNHIANADMFGVPFTHSGPVPRLRSSNNCVISRRLFETLGPPLFDPRFGSSGGEDVLLFTRCQQRGGKIVWTTEAVVREGVPADRGTDQWVLKRHRASATNAARIDRLLQGSKSAPRQLMLAAKETLAGLARLASGDPERRFVGRLRLEGAAGRLNGLLGHTPTHDTQARISGPGAAGAAYRVRVCCFPLSLPENTVLENVYGRVDASRIDLRNYGWVSSSILTSDLFDVHWPDATVMGVSGPKCALKLAIFLGGVMLFRLRNAPILYHVHNIGSHDRTHPRIEALLWRVFLPRVDVFVHMNRASVESAIAQWPQLANARHEVIPLPHYRDELDASVARAAARQALNLEPDTRLFMTFGLLRPYKGLEDLVEAFKGLADPNARLAIVGRPWNEAYGAEIQALCQDDARIRFIPGFLPPDQLHLWLKACDVTVIAHRKVNNSGVAVMALSEDRHLVAPARGALPELAEQVGPDWITLFHELTPAVLAQAAERAAHLGATDRPDLSTFDPATLGEALTRLYQQLAASRSAASDRRS